MGNSCVGSRSSAANNGTRGSSVPSSYWWCCGYKYGSHACKCDKTNAKATETIQDMPPQIVRIESDEVKPPHRYKEEKPPSEQTRPQPRPHNVKKPASAGLKADSVLQRKTGEIFSDVVGSPYYVAPEVLRKRYGPEADVWSAGVIIYILLSGVPPFWGETEQEIFDAILRFQLDFSSDPWPSISASAKDLVRKMLVRDPSKRITAFDVLRHPWIQVDGEAPDKPLDSAVLSRLKQFYAMNKLKKMALRVIAENLSEEEIAGLKEMFKMIDSDNSGQITFEELKIGLKKFGANLNESEIYDLMQAADVDNSGTIDYGEFIAATLHLNKIEREDHLVAAFAYFDKDGSGYITQDELQKACEEFGIGDVRLEEMMREADQDNDGRIDYNEFVAMMQKGNADLGKRGRKGSTSFRIGFREALPVC
ncbi:hypothetical protein ACSQ67_015841 [Phaseolus vulgaris]